MQVIPFPRVTVGGVEMDHIVRSRTQQTMSFRPEGAKRPERRNLLRSIAETWRTRDVATAHPADAPLEMTTLVGGAMSSGCSLRLSV